MLKQGIHEKVNPSVYQEDEAISRSDLLLVAKCPAYYRWIKANKEDESSPALDLGHAFHTMMIEPEIFDTRHVQNPYDSFRTNEAKDWRDKTKAEGKTIIGKSDRDDLLGMGISARQHPRYAPIMEKAMREATVIARHEGTGLTRKARPDAVPAGNSLVDFKSARDASPEGFGRAVWDMGYAQQAAHYLDCWNAVSERKKTEFIFFVVESSEPYLCAVYSTPHELIEYGRKLNNAQLYTLSHCIKSNVWPGYKTEIDEFEIPRWAAKEIEAVT